MPTVNTLRYPQRCVADLDSLLCGSGNYFFANSFCSLERLAGLSGTSSACAWINEWRMGIGFLVSVWVICCGVDIKRYGCAVH